MTLNSPSQITRTVATVTAPGKAALSISQMLILGFQAGAYIAFGGWFMISVTRDLPALIGQGLTSLVAGLVFCVGLVLVLLAGAELFTGNCLVPMGVLQGSVTVKGLLRNWLWVYLANFAGAVAVAWLIYNTGLWRGATGMKALAIASAKMNLTWTEVFFRGMLCNWLVVLAVWISMASGQVVGKIAAVILPISAFVASGFEHSVANMFFLSMGLLLKGAGLPADPALLQGISLQGMAHNLIPCTLGNIVGGTLFVTFLYFRAYRQSLGRHQDQGTLPERSRG